MPHKKPSKRLKACSANLRAYHKRKSAEVKESVTEQVASSALPSTSAAASFPSFSLRPSMFYKKLSHAFEDEDVENDFILRLSEDEEEPKDEVEDVSYDAPDDDSTLDDATSGASGAELRSKLPSNFLSHKENPPNVDDNDGDIGSLPLNDLKEVLSNTLCKECLSPIKLEFGKNAFDLDLKLKCQCEEPYVFQHRKVKESDNVDTHNIGETTCSFVYQNMLNGGGLAAINNTRAALGAKPLANSTYQRYKEYIENITEKKYKESMVETDEAIFRHYASIGVTPGDNE